MQEIAEKINGVPEIQVKKIEFSQNSKKLIFTSNNNMRISTVAKRISKISNKLTGVYGNKKRKKNKNVVSPKKSKSPS